MGCCGIALPLIDHGARKWKVSITPQPLYAKESDTVPIVQENGWASELISIDLKNLTPTKILTPDHPAHTESPY